MKPSNLKLFTLASVLMMFVVIPLASQPPKDSSTINDTWYHSDTGTSGMMPCDPPHEICPYCDQDRCGCAAPTGSCILTFNCSCSSIDCQRSCDYDC